jgi:hypothetical protein
MSKVAFGDETMSRRQVSDVFSKFISGVTSLSDNECSGYPCTSKQSENVVQVKRNICFIICCLATEVGISFGSCCMYLTSSAV